jgi:hypothetical protein
MGAALNTVRDSEAVEGTVVDPDAPRHVLVLGEEEFACGDTLPIGTLIRHADNDLLGIHHVLVKLVDEDEHDRMWDAFEALGQEEVMEAVKNLVSSYSPERPTGRSGSSRTGSRRTKRR